MILPSAKQGLGDRDVKRNKSHGTNLQKGRRPDPGQATEGHQDRDGERKRGSPVRSASKRAPPRARTLTDEISGGLKSRSEGSGGG